MKIDMTEMYRESVRDRTTLETENGQLRVKLQTAREALELAIPLLIVAGGRFGDMGDSDAALRYEGTRERLSAALALLAEGGFGGDLFGSCEQGQHAYRDGVCKWCDAKR